MRQGVIAWALPDRVRGAYADRVEHQGGDHVRGLLGRSKSLEPKLREWEAQLNAQDYPESTVSTYVGGSEIFLRWLSGEWRPTGPRR